MNNMHFWIAPQDLIGGLTGQWWHATFSLLNLCGLKNLEQVELGEVVVSGFQSGIIKGLNKQKSDVNVTNVVSADQIGKFPDDNVGDVIKRIAGIEELHIRMISNLQKMSGLKLILGSKILKPPGEGIHIAIILP